MSCRSYLPRDAILGLRDTHHHNWLCRCCRYATPVQFSVQRWAVFVVTVFEPLISLILVIVGSVSLTIAQNWSMVTDSPRSIQCRKHTRSQLAESRNPRGIAFGRRLHGNAITRILRSDVDHLGWWTNRANALAIPASRPRLINLVLGIHTLQRARIRAGLTDM